MHDFVPSKITEQADLTSQIVLSENRSYLAITSDSGSVWVLDVKIGELSKMRASHTSVSTVFKLKELAKEGIN